VHGLRLGIRFLRAAARVHSSAVEHSPYKRGVRRFKSYCAHQISQFRAGFGSWHAEFDRGLHTSPTSTVRQAVDDWPESGLPGRSERTRSVYREALMPLIGQIGSKPPERGHARRSA
jgi:hypothetical protein